MPQIPCIKEAINGSIIQVPNKAAGNPAGAQVSPACRLCEGCEEYYTVMYAKPVTVSATTCSSCGSSCEECEKAENLFSKGARPSYEFSNECQEQLLLV